MLSRIVIGFNNFFFIHPHLRIHIQPFVKRRISNIVGTGPKYDPKKTAGHVHALCYYDLNETSKPMVEMLAQRFGGTFDTEITSSGTAYFDKLGQLIATGNSPDIVRYDWMSYPYGMSKNMYTPLDEWPSLLSTHFLLSSLKVSQVQLLFLYNSIGLSSPASIIFASL